MSPWLFEKVILVGVILFFASQAAIAIAAGSIFKGLSHLAVALNLFVVLHTFCRLHWVADFEFKLNNAGLLPK